MHQMPLDKKHIYLHIGTHKTGSSAIQQAMKKHQSFLKDNGYYPLWLLQDLLEIHKFLFSGSGEAALGEDKIRCLREKLLKYFANIDEDKVIISAEVFAMHPWEVRAERIERLLRGLYSSMTIVAYCRRQDSYVESLFQQVSKNNMVSVSFDDFINDNTSQKRN